MKTLYTYIGLFAWLTPLLLVVAIVPGKAQTKATVQGVVTDAAGKPLEFVTILLVKSTDSSLVKGSITTTAGQYEIENVVQGSYLVATSRLGYEKVYSKEFSLHENQLTYTVPALIIREDVKVLAAVEVKATRPFIEQQVDKTVMNVENSLVSAGGNALEVLEKAPGVVVDAQNKRITMKGREGVLIMIDGKPTYLSTTEVMNLLRSTPSNSINSIEIISNPSAKYDAAGNSGIINIRLKRNSSQYGMNGNVALGGGYGRFPKANTGITLTMRQGNLSMMGNYTYDHREGYGAIAIERHFPENPAAALVKQQGYRPNQTKGHTFKLGADYTMGKKNTFGVLLHGIVNHDKADIQNENQVFTNTSVLQSVSKMTNTTDRRMQRIATTINYKHTFDSTGRELTADADYSVVNIRPTDNLITSFFNASGEETAPTLLQRTIPPSYVYIRAAKADYVHPINKQTRLETGWKSSYVTSDNDVRFEQLEESTWQVDPDRTNHFLYKEIIHAAYMNGNITWKKWAVQAGLRGEQTHSIGNSVTLHKVVDRTYLNLFPSAFLTYSIHEKHQIRYSYSRRIDRPNYLNLNPFIYVMDPYAYYQGNPYLNPQYTNALQLAYTWKGATTVSIGYNHTKGVITSVTEQNDETKVTKQTVINLDELTSLDLNLSFPVQITRWWNSHQTINVFRNRYNSHYLGQQLDNGRLSGNFSTNHSFLLPGGFTAELNAWYNAPSAHGLSQMRGFGQVSMGVQKQLWDKKATVRVNVTDLFLTAPVKGVIAYQNMDIRFRSSYESRTVRVNFTYNFGNTTIKAPGNRRSGAEEEQNRVN
ncbi:TonB-dependent receptor [Rhodocytophaga aerolata]|uniref:TonB-dependent receptor n=1 Tax=Rhodocytophaga aerolata TaxID=455078 RepID=A0ABT8R759_9BACT|nr:outer membrane beta-barrel protein [Rhodocytophaga aerolata]MDO1447083.1 TonB-dependent receptor [Rhodocytophaga aerolata]